MSSDNQPSSAQLIRDAWVSRLLLLQRLGEMLVERSKHCTRLRARVRQQAAGLGVYPVVDYLYQVWLLSENVLCLHELLAQPRDYDVTLGDRRRAALDRLRTRIGESVSREFICRAFRYDDMLLIIDARYLEARGFEDSRGRAVLSGLFERSINVLLGELRAAQRFYDEFRLFCNAVKHGRSVFALDCQFEEGSDRFRFRADASECVVSAWHFPRDDQPGPVRVLQYTMDDTSLGEIDRVHAALQAIVARQHDQLVSLTEAAEDYARATMGGESAGGRQLILRIGLFAETETEEEERLLGPPLRPGLGEVQGYSYHEP